MSVFEHEVKTELCRSVIKHGAAVSAFDPGLVAMVLESHMGLGLWRIEFPKRVAFLSQPILVAFGDAERAGPMALDTMLAHFVAADRAVFLKLINNAVAAKCGFKATLRLEVSKRVRLVEILADVDTTLDGRVLSLVGTLRDITQIAESEALSRSRSQLFKSVMHNIPSAVAILDLQMRYLSASDHWAAGHGIDSVASLIGKCHYDILPHARAHKAEHKLVLAGKTLRRKRAYLRDRKGNPIEQFSVMCPWRTPKGNVGGMIIMLGTVDIRNTLKYASASGYNFTEPSDKDTLSCDLAEPR